MAVTKGLALSPPDFPRRFSKNFNHLRRSCKQVRNANCSALRVENVTFTFPEHKQRSDHAKTGDRRIRPLHLGKIKETIMDSGFILTVGRSLLPPRTGKEPL